MADKKTLTPEEKKLAAEKHVDELVQKGLVALEEMRKLNQEQVDYIVAKASVAALDAHGILAEHAVKETGRGVFEDKATKNLFACEHVVNNMRGVKTVGVIEDDPITGLTKIAEPVGVICGITPTTNPTSTAIFKSLISLKTRNPIIFAFHPSAQESSAHAAQIVRDAAIAAGAPENCVQWITQPSMEATTALMNHEGIATILATGGNAMVKAAYSCGKPALGVGLVVGVIPQITEYGFRHPRDPYQAFLPPHPDPCQTAGSPSAYPARQRYARRTSHHAVSAHAGPPRPGSPHRGCPQKKGHSCFPPLHGCGHRIPPNSSLSQWKPGCSARCYTRPCCR